MNRSTWRNLGVVAAGIAVMGAVTTLSNRDAQAQASPTATRVPVFEVDPSWPKLPNNWVLGQTPGVAVDSHDHIWVLHRPRTVPEAQRAQAAPPLLEFDADGKFLRAWGGPGPGFDWPDSEHGVFVDSKDNVWIGGSSPTSTSLTKRSDNMLLKFAKDGKFLLQIGGPDKGHGNADTNSVNKPADAFVHQKTNELYVADGYGNRRVIVFDANTAAFKRMWGAFGNAPVDAQPVAAGRGAAAFDIDGPGPQQFGGPVHAVKVSNDDLVYVADRQNRRLQVFSLAGKYVTQTFINRSGPANGSVAGIAFSADRAQQFMYLADYGNSHIVVMDRKSLTILYQFGTRSAGPGDFQGIHHLAANSKGDLVAVEVAPGNRIQRFRFKGLSNTLPSNALTPEQLAATPVAPNQAAPASATPPSSASPQSATRRARFRHPVRRAAAIRRGRARWRIRTA